MFFKNLTLMRFPRTLITAGVDLDAALATQPLKPVGPLEMSSRGFVSPFGRGSESMAHTVSNRTMFTLGGEDKLLPSAVVNEQLAQKIEAATEQQGRRPGGAERKRLKEEVLTNLLPRALAKPSRTNAYLDPATGWLVVDTSSRKTAETVVTKLRESMGSFPALPVSAEASPRALMTGWLAGEDLPEGFALGDEVELRDPADTQMVVKCQRHDLRCEEVQEHLKAGKQVFKLALTFEDRLSFVLGEDLVIRKLKFLEAATESLEEDNRDSLEAELDAVFALMSGELARLLSRLEDILSLSSADTDAAPPRTRQATQGGNAGQTPAPAEGEDDPLITAAMKLVIADQSVSVQRIQRHLQVGYNRASRLIEAMEGRGVVGPPAANGDRAVLMELRRE